ncbi:membrane transporter [Schizosaccharomyces japonicus yFS275]|uniref:Membrane transporter n=1 Tax=Schizosaccharomyces japonicus (strain yFS275 / FY16936) TaxID=402676 RepID=B6K357_SCHJY|nr:membrane transporter [Schizosaccharomyces japonicus yFS275]EEB07914.1 membrane transporter [Schizosaccharomyces japonicus yFS275]
MQVNAHADQDLDRDVHEIDLTGTKGKELLQTQIELRSLSRVGNSDSHLEYASSQKSQNRSFIEANHTPPKISIALILLNSFLLDVSLTIVVPTSAAYTEHLGGKASFSGLTIGIPNLIALLFMWPVIRFASPKSAHGYTLYFRPLVISGVSSIVGNLFYVFAGKSNVLYFILIGRILNGAAFTMFLFHKRYLTDKLLVGVNKRTFLGGLNILAQTFGMMAGPFIGGLMAKATIHSKNAIWNQYTSGTWVWTGVWVVYLIASAFLFKEVTGNGIAQETTQPENDTPSESQVKLSKTNKFMLFTLSLAAFVSYFTIDGYQTSIPIYTEKQFGFSNFASGNFLALGALVIAPFVLCSSYMSRWLGDREIVLYSLLLGLFGVLLHIILISAHAVTTVSYFFSYVIMFLGLSITVGPLLSLLSKQLHPRYHELAGFSIQFAVCTSNTIGSVCGSSIYSITPIGFAILCLAQVVLCLTCFPFLWSKLKTKLK